VFAKTKCSVALSDIIHPLVFMIYKKCYDIIFNISNIVI